MTENFNSSIEIDKFLDSVYVISHSQSTVKAYKLGIKHFEEFINATYRRSLDEILASIKTENEDPYKILNEFVVFLDKKGKMPNTIKLSLTGIRGFLRHCGVKIYTEDFRARVKIPKAIRTREEPLTKEIILRVLNNTPPKLRTIILVAASTGMRIGEIIQLKISDIDFESKPTRIRIRGETTKTRESREAFLTSEATKALKDYLTRYLDWNENSKNDTWIFITGKSKSGPAPDIKSIAGNLANQMKKHISNVPELSKVHDNGVHMIHFHAFRKYFRTVVGNAVGRDFAEALMGHHFYLDTYYNLPEDKKREMYLKAEPYLTISDFTKIERELVSVTERQKELEKNYLELLQKLKSDHLVFPKALEKYIK